MTTVNSMIEQLQRQQAQGRGELNIIAMHGASGTYEPTGGVYLTEVEEGDDALLDMAEGTKFVILYTGN